VKTKPMNHQVTYLERSEGKRNFAILAEQGTGKSWMLLADAERAFMAGKIEALIIWAPKGVHSNWVLREIPKHLSVPTVCYAWSGPVKTKRQKAAFDKLNTPNHRFERPTLRVLTINFEAMLQENARDVVDEFMNTFVTLGVVDESKKIGNPDAKRTKYIIKAGRAAIARRILSGKPLTKAPMDLYSQFDFLKPGLLGTTSYRAFVAEYAVLLDPKSPKMQGLIRKMGPKAAFAQVVDTDDLGNKKYQNLDKLAAMIAPHMYRVRKDECLDLPPKVYEPVYFDLSDEQRALYDKLKDELAYTSRTEGEMSFQAIAARSKMKQVTSGFVNVYGEPELINPDSNPRMEAFLDVVDDLEGQFIVWAIYRHEIEQIVKVLGEQGISCVEYHGGIKDDAREIAVDSFQAGQVRAFVCNKAAYAGLTLTAARTSIYFSCDYDNDVRGQSEDRNHRIGTTGPVLYVDLIARDTMDEDIARNLAVKDAIADHIIDGMPMTI
jgi:SNF2 family DNA or RNA helicase